MSTLQTNSKVIKNKVGLLNLAQELGNISKKQTEKVKRKVNNGRTRAQGRILKKSIRFI
jgi:hypothetical protein